MTGTGVGGAGAGAGAVAGAVGGERVEGGRELRSGMVVQGRTLSFFLFQSWRHYSYGRSSTMWYDVVQFRP